MDAKKIIENSDKLIDYYFRVAVRENSSKDYFDELKVPYEFVTGDLKNQEYLQYLCKDCSVLFHIAGIDKSLLLVKAAVKAGVKRIILVHTTGIYFKYKEAGEEYRQIEIKIKEMIADKNISLTILRPTMIYGALNDGNISIFIKMVDKLKVFPVVDGARYKLQPVWAKDLGEAYYKVLINPQITGNKNYVLSGGSEIYLIEIFHYIEEYLGKKNQYISVPFQIAYVGAWLFYIVTLGKKDYREKVQRLVEPRIYSYEEANKDFGYKPVPFHIGVCDEVQMYLNSQHK